MLLILDMTTQWHTIASCITNHICEGNSSVTWVTSRAMRNFGVSMYKLLNNQSSCLCFETSWRPYVWRHCDECIKELCRNTWHSFSGSDCCCFCLWTYIKIHVPLLCKPNIHVWSNGYVMNTQHGIETSFCRHNLSHMIHLPEGYAVLLYIAQAYRNENFPGNRELPWHQFCSQWWPVPWYRDESQIHMLRICMCL